MDETLFVKRGKWRTKTWCTSLVDVRAGRLLDIIEGRSSVEPCRWLAKRGEPWCAQILWGTLDMSGPYRAVFDTMLPDAVQIADPFHVHRLANSKLDAVRRRVQNDTTGHRGRADDALYRARRLLVMADERLAGLLTAGDPRGEVRMAWHAKQVVRSIYDHDNAAVALEFVDRLGLDLQDGSQPPEMHQLGRTLRRWKHPIANWHKAHLTNAPTEAANNLIKRVKRGGFGFTNFANYRTRVLLYAGRPNWDLLPTINPH